MHKHKEQRENPIKSRRFWILGAGRFGRIAVMRIQEKVSGAIITVVDEAPVAFDAPRVTVVRQDAIQWLSTMLTDPAPVDWIVPAIPVHAAHLWLVRRAAVLFHVQSIHAPDRWLSKMPHALRGQTGQVYVSHADFICPDNCPEPKQRCTHTGDARPTDLFRLLEKLRMDDVLPIVLRSHQLRPGVGGILPDDLLGAYQTVLQNHHRVLMIATACRCHGVVDFMRLEKKSGPRASGRPFA